MKKIVLGLGVVLLAGAFMVGKANVSSGGCDNPRNEFDDHYCFLQLYIQTDRDLNTAYQELKAKLNEEGQRLLKTSELRWIAEREKRVLGVIADERVFFMGRALRMTDERLAFLKARIRECNSTGCANSKLR